MSSIKYSLRNFCKKLLLTFIVSFLNIYPQTNLKNNISSGLEALYNFNFKSSDRIFDNLIENYPESPAGYHYKSISSLWFYLDSKNEIDYENFMAYTDTAIEKAEVFLETDSNDVFKRYILGSVYANRTFAFTRNENYFDAIFAASKFYSYFNELLEIDSLYYDAYMGKGLYNFAISQAPQTWAWALSLSGMTGDKQKGLEYLEIATRKGNLSMVDAQFYLSQIYCEFLQKYSAGGRILNNLNTRFPNNLLFRYALATYYLKIYDMNDALRNYKTVFASKDTNFIQLKNYAGLALGDIYFSQGEYESSRMYHKNFFEFSSDAHFKGITALKLGLSHLLENDSLSALIYFDKISEGNEDLDEDLFARIKGEQYLNKLPDSNELKLILIKNLIDAGKFRTAVDSLENYVKQSISDTLRSEAILYFSEAYYHLGKNKKSLEYAVSVFNFDDCELWVKPFACYNAARASKALNNIIDAKLFIEYTGNFKNYFFENKLKDKLNFLSFLLDEKK